MRNSSPLPNVVLAEDEVSIKSHGATGDRFRDCGGTRCERDFLARHGRVRRKRIRAIAASCLPVVRRMAAEIKRMTNNAIEILLVEDNLGDAGLLREMFKRQRSHVIALTHVECMSDAEKQLAENEFDIILLDLGLPDAEGLVAVRRSRAAAPHVPLVVLTGLDDEALAGQVLQEGAQEHLIKGQIETRALM